MLFGRERRDQYMKRLPLYLLFFSLYPSVAFAKTLTVGSGKSFPDPCAAIAKAADGDVIEVDPGTYTIACKVGISVTVRGVGSSKPILEASSPISNGKGIFAVEGANVNFVAERLVFTGAKVSDKNGAGIRFQGHDLVVRECVFHDNENGILSSGTGEELVEGSEFYANGAGDGQSHNLYMGASSRFIFRYNWTRSAKTGHLLKSRSHENWILFNRITEETETEADNINLPNGGKTYILGNLIEQIDSANGNMIRFGVEGNKYGADSTMFLVHNTIINHRNKGAFLIVDKSITTTNVIANNLFFGQGSLPTSSVTSVGNVMRTLADIGKDLVNDASFDYHLKSGAAAIDKGVDVSAYLGGTPLEQYIHPLQHAPRTQQGNAPDSGAYEFGDSGQGGFGGSGQGGNGSGGAGQGGSTTAGAGGNDAGQGGSTTAGAGGDGQGGDNQGGEAGQAQGGNEQGGSGGGTTAGAGGSTTAGAGGSTAAGQGGSTAAGKGGQAQGGNAQGGVGGGGSAGKVSTAGSGGASGAGVSGSSGQTNQATEPQGDSQEDSGCGCRTVRGSSNPWGAWGMLGLAFVVLFRRRR